MEITNRLKKLAFSLAIVGFISAIFLFGLIFGLGIGWEIAYKDNKFFPIGYNPIQDLASIYLIISVLLLMFIAFLRMHDRIFLKAIALIPLFLTLLQCRILLLTQPDSFPSWITEYSSWLGIVLYIGYFFLALTVGLVIIQFHLIWSIRYLSYKNP